MRRKKNRNKRLSGNSGKHDEEEPLQVTIEQLIEMLRRGHGSQYPPKGCTEIDGEEEEEGSDDG